MGVDILPVDKADHPQHKKQGGVNIIPRDSFHTFNSHF